VIIKIQAGCTSDKTNSEVSLANVLLKSATVVMFEFHTFIGEVEIL